MRIVLASLLIFGFVTLPVRAARACGGGVVTVSSAPSVTLDAQRILISVHGGVTDVVTQIGVPNTTADYGVLIPVPSQPALDPTPVMSVELDTLFSATAPQIFTESASGDDGFGCGCPVATGSGSKGGVGGPRGGTQVSAPVTIGPVTVVTLTADTGAAINAWLADNGFALPADGPAIVDSYAGPGRYFIAIRRADTAATGAATSVGLHFTLAGDQRGLPLRFARIGAGATVGFSVLVVTEDGESVAPSAPFTALTLVDLDRATLRTSGYAAAVSAAIAERDDRAFVIEGVWGEAELERSRITSLRPFIPDGARLTRLSTLLPATALAADVTLDQPFSGTAPRQLYVQDGTAPTANPKLAFGFALFAVAALARRRLRR